MTDVLTTACEPHIEWLNQALDDFGASAERSVIWGRALADLLLGGGRLLVAGNGGSAAQAQHLSSEIVGRYCQDRPPFSAVSLAAEPAALTAIVNDYGSDQMFARQVQAHGRPGDLLVLMSTSGRSSNLVAAAVRARECGLRTWAMTGPLPNPLGEQAQECLSVNAPRTATVQELHLVALHMVCEAMDARLLEVAGPASAPSSSRGKP
jgi:D-sedoheptulose 7-phosphate isomerase